MKTDTLYKILTFAFLFGLGCLLGKASLLSTWLDIAWMIK